MRLHRLRVQSFAAIRDVEIAFGPGLNILYGPNDLGKSTLADAIRLALLLPHTSTGSDPYIPWSGANDPFVDLTFQTEEQRFWRVRKQFGKGGSSLLQESRNGQDFDDVERARRVDARLREILGWGIPEPGAGSGKGLPASFLSAALLSTQANVSDILAGSLDDDPTTTGKERIAAALQAVAQDPLFVALLRETQERRDEGYTEKGAKKTAKGSVFKLAADRVKEARDEKERLQKIVEDSEGVEQRLRALSEERQRLDQELAAAAERLIAVEQLAQQAADHAAAADRLRAAQDAVLRIHTMDQNVADAEKKVEALAAAKNRAEQTLKDHQAAEAAARDALTAAEETQAQAQRAEAARTEQAANEELRRCDLLQRAWEARAADKLAASAQADVDKETVLQEQRTKTADERAATAERRARITVPPAASLPALRKLATDLASAKGALDVGLVMTIIPTALVNVRVRKDGEAATDLGILAKPLDVDASTEVEVDIADLATVRVRGGRREAQERLRTLETHWAADALPHLKAAGVEDLDALDAKIAEARDLDSHLKKLAGDLETLDRQINALAGAAGALQEAATRAAACHQALGDTRLETLTADLDALGPDPGSTLRTRRQQALASLQSLIDAKKSPLEAALAGVREATEKARSQVKTAQEDLTQAITHLASEEGRLAELRKVRTAADLAAAEADLRTATQLHNALPAPERPVLPAEVTAAKDALQKAKRDLATVDRDLHITQGMLQQVGGAVARDHLRDALEALEQAERHDREIEADYEAWRLLLDEMKAADAAQASNLGQVLAPAIADRFQALTQQRYQSLHLTAHLGTEGVLAAGKLRSPDLLSVGTREQLSTLYRLCLGEYLQTTIVLDDQLVQSDDNRMEWFRALLAEKARAFQIIVFTCRPGDYLDAAAMAAEDGPGSVDSEEGFVRAIDLGRAVERGE
ncbi:MAG TPA: AAA family ATPase [Thermoanaerobaculia bacterium]|nr:AAA family ATPase [Thermoanaerobaculia bacterium]